MTLSNLVSGLKQIYCTNFGSHLVIFNNSSYNTAQKIKFSIKDFFNKRGQIRRFLRIWSHLLKKSLMENFNFCAVQILVIFPITTRFRPMAGRYEGDVIIFLVLNLLKQNSRSWYNCAPPASIKLKENDIRFLEQSRIANGVFLVSPQILSVFTLNFEQLLCVIVNGSVSIVVS